MKLFKIEVTYETVILAENLAAAELLGPGIIKGTDESENTVWSSEIKTLGDLPPGWDGKCRPWGEEDPFDRTIEKILENPDKKVDLHKKLF